MILVIDNYDSFTYNLVQYLGELGADLVVKRNDAITVDEVGTLAPAAIVLSPGPCTPKEAGITVDVIRRWGPTIPTLGVCLGHQAIGEAYGGDVVLADRVMHGKTSQVRHDGRGGRTARSLGIGQNEIRGGHAEPSPQRAIEGAVLQAAAVRP